MDGDTFISCFQHPRTGEASCMDAICTGWALREAYNYNDDPALVGTCTTDGRLMACDTNGRLKDAAECPNGSTCSPYDDSYVNGQFDGYRGGKCQTQCQDGAQECIGATGEYRVCNEGLWETTRCADGASCNQEGNTVFCGQCVAGRTGCSGDQIVTCDDNGMWGDPQDCSYGSCESVTVGSREIGACIGQCAPGEIQCNGIAEASSCEEGIWSSYTACEEGLECREAYSGVALGCVECVGSRNGGNAYYHAADVGCGEDDEVIVCGPDNTWQAPTACDTDYVCVESVQYSASTEESLAASCQLPLLQ